MRIKSYNLSVVPSLEKKIIANAVTQTLKKARRHVPLEGVLPLGQNKSGVHSCHDKTAGVQAGEQRYDALASLPTEAAGRS